MYKNALLIYNGNAGQDDMDKIMEKIIPILSEGIDNLTLSKTKSAGDGEIIAREKGKDYELIISLGGDGTLHEVINGIAELEKPPLVGILPGGTCNDFARSLNISLELKDAARQIVQGQVKKIDIGKVNGRYFTNFVGLGLITDISENVNPDTKNIMGRISYYTSAIKSMAERETFKFTLKTENGKIKDKAKMIAILNGYHIGANLVPVKSIEVDDGLLDIFIVYDTGFSVLMKYLTKKENFKDSVSEDQIKQIKAKKISIKTKEKMDIDTDGEVYLTTPVDINLANKSFKFIVG